MIKTTKTNFDIETIRDAYELMAVEESDFDLQIENDGYIVLANKIQIGFLFKVMRAPRWGSYKQRHGYLFVGSGETIFNKNKRVIIHTLAEHITGDAPHVETLQTLTAKMMISISKFSQAIETGDESAQKKAAQLFQTMRQKRNELYPSA